MTNAISYRECLKTLYGFRRFGIKLGLSKINGILAGLGNPHRTFSCIHIAGTNGKGSIASALSTILSAAGYTTGLYTSPHLIRFNERICVNGVPIADDAVVAAYAAVRTAHRGDREPTFFEFATAMALFEFGRQRVDWAVIETGMGGRLDATNVVMPAVSVITNISVEHREYLGDTIASIAAEKGGIIKPGIPVVTGVRQMQALDVLHAVAADRNAPLLRLGAEFRVRRSGDGTFSYKGPTARWRSLKTAMSGAHQVQNAALALATCEVLNDRCGTAIGETAIRDGLSRMKWPGRLEVVASRPLVILDGAHNLAAARNLGRYLKENLAGRRLTLVVGILDDKPYAAMLKALLPACHRLILTRPVIDRALEPERLLTAAEGMAQPVEIIPDVGKAVARAMTVTPPEDAVCVAGSLYVVGEAKASMDPSVVPDEPV